MVDVYSTEAERRAALDEVTRLRRQFDTTTAKGAKAFAKSEEAQAALARLDAAKTAAGMRTSKQDLAALNRIATSDTATIKKDEEGRMTAAPTKAERDVTKQLNAPSRQYFKQIQQAYKNPDVVPNWNTGKQITPDIVAQWDDAGWDTSKARYDWVLYEDNQGRPRWGQSVIGAIRKRPTEIKNIAHVLDYWMSDSASVSETANTVLRQLTGSNNWRMVYGDINLDELSQAIPEIKFSQFQEVMYQLSLEKDEDITIEDILDKYDEMYGKG